MADQLLHVVVAILATIVVLGAVVLIHEAGHFVTARLSGMRVLEFGVGFPPRARVLTRRGETDYTLNWLPIGGFVKLEGEETNSDDPRAFTNSSLWKQLLVLAAGPAMNIVLAFVLFFFLAWFADPVLGVQIGEVSAGSPAASAGLQVGDTIESVNGQRFGALAGRGVIEALREHAGQSVTLGYITSGGAHKTVTVHLASPQDVAAGKGALGIRAGSKPIGGYVGTDPVAAIGLAGAQTQEALSLILGGLRDIGSQLVTNPTQAPPGVGGPVEITRQVGFVLWDYGPIFVIYLAAILSANLALVNILPFPPLDGGKMAVLAIKRVVGSRGVSALEATTYVVGFALLMAFILWISYFDITRLAQ